LKGGRLRDILSRNINNQSLVLPLLVHQLNALETAIQVPAAAPVTIGTYFSRYEVMEQMSEGREDVVLWQEREETEGRARIKNFSSFM
jgi:hypothetical protein